MMSCWSLLIRRHPRNLLKSRISAAPCSYHTSARRARQTAIGRARRAPAQAAVPATLASGRTAGAGGTRGGQRRRRHRGDGRERRRGPRPWRGTPEEATKGGGGTAHEDPPPSPGTASPPPPPPGDGRAGQQGERGHSPRAERAPRPQGADSEHGSGNERPPPPRPSATEGEAEARRMTPGTGGRATWTPPPRDTPPPPQRALGGVGRGVKTRPRGPAGKPGPVRRVGRAHREGASQGGQP